MLFEQKLGMALLKKLPHCHEYDSELSCKVTASYRYYDNSQRYGKVSSPGIP